MKKSIFTLAVLCCAISLNAQQPMFVEYFTNRYMPDYDSLIAKCKANNAVFVMNHIYSSDTLTCADSKQRMKDKGCHNVPTGYLHGRVLPDSLNVPWDSLNTSYGGYVTEISCLQGMVTYLEFMQPIYSLKVNLSNSTLSGCTVSMFFVEKVGKFQNVTRRYIKTGYYGKPLTFNISWKGWDINKCTVIVVVEDENYNVVGVRSIGVKESLMTLGMPKVEQLTISIYPNPVIDQFNIIGSQPLGIIRLYSLFGGEILRENISSATYQVNMAGRDNGLYILTIGKSNYKIIKQ